MNIDLYRLFFPIGWLLGVWGAVVWVLHYYGIIPYPGIIHPEIMMGGFLLSFVFGFLGTAAPKFTNSFPPTKNEMRMALVLACFLFISQFFTEELVFRFSSLSIFLFLIYFLVKRFQKRTSNPPAPFVFVGLGVLTGTIGSIILILARFGLVSEEQYMLGRLFFYQAYILSFVLGIGSRLIPSLLGHAPPPNLTQSGMSVKTYSMLGLLFIGTYLIEAFVSGMTGALLRDLVVLFIGIVSWKIHLLPKRKAIHAYGLWLSAIFMVIGYISASFSEIYRVHLMHLFYISGLSLMTIMVATRVTLSHGNHDMLPEVNARSLKVVIALFITASIMRLFAGLMPDLLLSHLFYAASLWLLGMIVWGVVFLPKIVKIHLK